MENLYGILIGIGIICCFLVIWYFEKKDKLEKKFIDFVMFNGMAAIAIGFFFSAVFQGIYNYIENPEAGFSLTGGITFLGGLIGGIVSFLVGYLIFGRKYETKLIDILYLVPSCILVAHGFGRVGCFFAKCCYGIETTSWLGVMVHGKKVLPTNLFEAIFLFIMFAVTFLIARKKKTPQLLTLYLFSYGVWRFIIEFYRGDYRGSFVEGISPSQFWSLLMIGLSIPVFFLLRYLSNKRIEQKKKN